MPSVEAVAKKLRQKAEQNTLEVEHLLALARTGNQAFVAVIRGLQAEQNWSHESFLDGQRVVPFGSWADVVCRYLEEGCGGVATLGTSPATRGDFAPFCIALLEEIRTADSVAALLQICGDLVDRPEANLPLAIKCAGAFNNLLSFKSAPLIEETCRSQVRCFLHKLMALDLPNPQRGLVICALRGVGDESSIALINSGPALTDAWSGTDKGAVREIQRRLRSGRLKPR